MSGDELVESVHRAVIDRATDPTEASIDGAIRTRAPLLTSREVTATRRRVLARVRGLGRLEELLADDDVTDLCVNGPGPVWAERRGELRRTEVHLTAAEVEHLVERVTAPLGRRADRHSPLVDGRLDDGSRVHIAMPPSAVDGPYVTIRRFAARTLPLQAFAAADVADGLRRAVADRRSIVVSGGTGAGKTTLLNALCQHLDRGERVVTIEDAAELRLPGDHVVRLEARLPTADGLAAITIRDLVRNALRMRPDRLVIGEVRGGEAVDLLQAMHTGHDGSLSTCHANDPGDALRRLETMALSGGIDLPLEAIRDQLASAIDLVVQVRRGPAGRRSVASVHAVSDDPGGAVRTVPLVEGDDVLVAPPW